MDDSQVEFVGMLIKVKTFLNKKAAQLTDTPVIASSLQPEVEQFIEDIFSEDEDASGTISGNTELKRELRNRVERIGFEVAAACAAYYTITVPNPVLRAKCNYQRTDLSSSNMRDMVLYVKMKVVHEIADPIKALLAPFGILVTDVDNLNNALEQYFAELEGPRDAIGERAASGRQVDRLIGEVRKLPTEQLDVVMKYYAVNDPELHDYYLNARSIDQTGGGPIPDEDETITLASGAFVSNAVAPEIEVGSRIVVINPASGGSNILGGFSTTLNVFSGEKKEVSIGETQDEVSVNGAFCRAYRIWFSKTRAAPAL